MKAIDCPHCGKPLEVQWEVWRYWTVALNAEGEPILTGEPYPFDGGECSECSEWVEPGDLQPHPELKVQ